MCWKFMEVLEVYGGGEPPGGTPSQPCTFQSPRRLLQEEGHVLHVLRLLDVVVGDLGDGHAPLRRRPPGAQAPGQLQPLPGAPSLWGGTGGWGGGPLSAKGK